MKFYAAMQGARCEIDRTPGAYCLLQSPGIDGNIYMGVQITYQLSSDDVILEVTFPARGNPVNLTRNANQVYINFDWTDSPDPMTLRAWRFLSTSSDLEVAVVQSVILSDLPGPFGGSF